MAKTLLKSASYSESYEYQTLIPRHGQYVPHRPVLPTIPIHQIPNITNAQQAVSTLAYHAKQLIHNSQTLATTQTKLGQLATLLTSIILSKTTQNQQLLLHTTTLKNLHSTFTTALSLLQHQLDTELQSAQKRLSELKKIQTDIEHQSHTMCPQSAKVTHHHLKNH